MASQLGSARLERLIGEAAQKIEALSPAERESLHAAMANDAADHASLQSTQAWAHAVGYLSTDAAQIVYMALGDPPASDGWAASATTAQRVIITQLFGELLRLKIAGRTPEAVAA